jgi:hypothetical protein
VFTWLLMMGDDDRLTFVIAKVPIAVMLLLYMVCVAAYASLLIPFAFLKSVVDIYSSGLDAARNMQIWWDVDRAARKYNKELTDLKLKVMNAQATPEEIKRLAHLENMENVRRMNTREAK